MGILELLSGAGKKNPSLSGRTADCPICKSKLRLDMKECPKCKHRIADLFTLICPECKANMPLDASECPKCRFNIAAPPKRRYLCPRCQYSADYWMLQCPACGVKFSS
jgi:ribosomal protein L40E